MQTCERVHPFDNHLKHANIHVQEAFGLERHACPRKHRLSLADFTDTIVLALMEEKITLEAGSLQRVVTSDDSRDESRCVPPAGPRKGHPCAVCNGPADP